MYVNAVIEGSFPIRKNGKKPQQHCFYLIKQQQIHLSAIGV